MHRGTEFSSLIDQEQGLIYVRYNVEDENESVEDFTGLTFRSALFQSIALVCAHSLRGLLSLRIAEWQLELDASFQAIRIFFSSNL